MGRSSETAIAVTGITKTYRSRHTGGGHPKRIIALSEVSLEIATGEVFGIVGESGSGKTTLGRLMVGLEAPDTGTVHVDGTRIDALRGRALKAFRSHIQMVFQDPYQSLNPYMSVLSAVVEPLTIHGRAKGERLQRAAAMLEAVGLAPAEAYLDSFPHQLSGGQRQRVAIARAMVLEPSILVADEPTSMLDASISVQLFRILADIQRRQGVTLVFITHSLAAANYLCDRLVVLYRGRLVEMGPARDLIAEPRHPYTQALIDALPRYGHGAGDRRFNSLLPAPRPPSHSGGCIFFDRCGLADPSQCTRSHPELRRLSDGHHVACFLA